MKEGTLNTIPEPRKGDRWNSTLDGNVYEFDGSKWTPIPLLAGDPVRTRTEGLAVVACIAAFVAIMAALVVLAVCS